MTVLAFWMGELKIVMAHNCTFQDLLQREHGAFEEAHHHRIPLGLANLHIQTLFTLDSHRHAYKFAADISPFNISKNLLSFLYCQAGVHNTLIRKYC